MLAEPRRPNRCGKGSFKGSVMLSFMPCKGSGLTIFGSCAVDLSLFPQGPKKLLRSKGNAARTAWVLYVGGFSRLLQITAV